MLRRLVVLLIESCVACVIALSVGLFWASHYVDTQEFRERFTSLVHSLVGREVVLDGELDIALYPSLSLEISGLRVLDSPEFGQVPLARIERLNVSVKLLPLLSRDVIIRSILVNGLHANVVRTPNGAVNWRAFLDERRASDPGEPFPVAINSVALNELEVVGTSVSYTDQSGGVELSLHGIDLKTGAIASGQKIPFVISSAFAWAAGGVTSEMMLKGMISSTEDWSSLAIEEASVYASVGGEFLPKGAAPGELTARLIFDLDKGVVGMDGLHARFLGLDAEGNLKTEDLSAGLAATGHITLKPFKPADIIVKFFPNAPVSEVDGLKNGAFTSFFAADEQGFSFTKMALSLDDLTVRGNLAVKGFASPRYEFALQGGLLDLDRYMPLLRTDTPFVWGDYHLDLFRRFLANGLARVEGFRLFDSLLSDVRLSVNAESGAIDLDGEAVNSDKTVLKSTAHLDIGKDDASGHPTLALKGELSAKSGTSGFGFLDQQDWRLDGEGTLTAQFESARMVCPPEDRSMNILRMTTAQASLALGKGEARLDRKGGNPLIQAYSKLKVGMTASPLAAAKKDSTADSGTDSYGFHVSAEVKGMGDKAKKSLALQAKGPFSFGVDTAHAASSGLTVAALAAGPLYLGRDTSISMGGQLAFDTRSHRFSLANGTLRTLETTLRGDVRVTDLDKKFKAAGALSITNADPSRIIYLLSRKTMEMNDPTALKTFSLSTDFTMDPGKFTMDNLSAELDGMKIKGNLIGTDLSDPMLSFAFTAGALDIDRYLPPSASEAERLAAGKPAKAPPVDLPLTFLRLLRLNGKGWFDEFKLGKVRARPFSAKVSADNGVIRVFDGKGVVHGGKLEGEMSGQVGKDSLATQLQLEIRGMQAGLLMTDMAGRDYVRGVTDLDLDLASSGKTDDDIVAALSGTTRVEIVDGSFKFSGYDAKPTVDEHRMSGQASNDPKLRRTVFKKAVNAFDVAKGVFTVRTLRVEAPPVLQCEGSGYFNLPDNTIDLSIRNDFVAVPSVTFNIVGKLTDPEVRIPKGKIVNDTVRNILSLPEKSFNFLRDLFK
jgi:AsmA protein